MEKYTLKMPERNVWLNEKCVWYVTTQSPDNKYLRPSMEILDSTGYDTDNSGYWATYEEALKAKEDYEKKQSESELVFPAYYMYIGDGIGHGDILHCETKHDCKLMNVDGYKNVEQLNLNMDVSDWSQMMKISEEEIYKIVEKKEKENTLKWFGSTNTENVFDEIQQERGDGGSTSYYKLPENAKELGDLIYHKEMNHSIGEAFCALYRLKDNGEYKRNLRKAKFYIDLELSRM